jgi:hypothetical protein
MTKQATKVKKARGTRMTKTEEITVAPEDRRRRKVVAFRMPCPLLAALDEKARVTETDRTEVLMACLWELVDCGRLPKVATSSDPRQSVLSL